MSLLDDVIQQASDGDASAMLRKLMIVSHRLGATDLLAWVKGELNGYEDRDSLPSYRGPLPVVVQATIVGPGGGKGTNTLTQHGVPEGYDDLFRAWFLDPLATLEGFARSDHGLSIPWDPIAVAVYNRWIEDGEVPFVEYWGVYAAHKYISQSSVMGVVDIVRTKALELALELQSEYPDAGEKGGPTVADPAVRETLTHITNNIYGNITGLAQGGTVQQNVVVEAGDIACALEVARSFLARSSLNDFAKLLTDDGDEEAKRTRLERFVSAVRAGSINLAGGVAAGVAADGLMALGSQFFGWV